MLKLIRIENFKAIQKQPLVLEDLAPINYLIGKNGCGKSSVLEALHGYYLIPEITPLVTYESKFRRGINKDKKASIMIDGNLRSFDSFGNFCNCYRCKINTDKDIFLPIIHCSNGSIINDEIRFEDNRIFNKEKNQDFKIKVGELCEGYRTFYLSDNDCYILKDDGTLEYEINTGLINTKQQEKYYTYLKDFGVGNDGFDKLVSQRAEGHEVFSKILHTIWHLNKKFGAQTILIEEPEKSLHPELQKQLPNLFKRLHEDLKIQFIISTHSNYIVSEALSLQGDNQKVYHFTDKGVVDKPKGIGNLNILSFNEVLGTLGVKPADMLFANGVIWVEGPSDAIYIKYWLELKGVKQGEDYEFSFYGGSVLNSFSGKFWKGLDNISEKQLIRMFAINTNCIIYMDSDFNKEGQSLEKQTQKKQLTKSRIKKEVEENGGKVWISDGREIENYIPSKSFEKLLENLNEKDKKDYLQSYGQWSNIWKLENPKRELEYGKKSIIAEKVVKMNIPLENFNFNLEAKIRKYVNLIKSWNK